MTNDLSSIPPDTENPVPTETQIPPVETNSSNPAPDPNTSVQTPPTNPKKKLPKQIIMALGVLIVLLGLAAFSFLPKLKTKQSQQLTVNNDQLQTTGVLSSGLPRFAEYKEGTSQV